MSTNRALQAEWCLRHGLPLSVSDMLVGRDDAALGVGLAGLVVEGVPVQVAEPGEMRPTSCSRAFVSTASAISP